MASCSVLSCLPLLVPALDLDLEGGLEPVLAARLTDGFRDDRGPRGVWGFGSSGGGGGNGGRRTGVVGAPLCVLDPGEACVGDNNAFAGAKSGGGGGTGGAELPGVDTDPRREAETELRREANDDRRIIGLDSVGWLDTPINAPKPDGCPSTPAPSVPLRTPALAPRSPLVAVLVPTSSKTSFQFNTQLAWARKAGWAPPGGTMSPTSYLRAFRTARG